MKQVLSITSAFHDGKLLKEYTMIRLVKIPYDIPEDVYVGTVTNNSEEPLIVDRLLNVSNLHSIGNNKPTVVCLKTGDVVKYFAIVNTLPYEVVDARELYEHIIQEYDLSWTEHFAINWDLINHVHKYDTAANSQHPTEHPTFKLYGSIFVTGWSCIDISTLSEPMFVIDNKWHMPLHRAVKAGLLR